jgi:hypothetical protein
MIGHPRRESPRLPRSDDFRLPPPPHSRDTVAAAEIQFENYVLSRGGTRLIRKILIANNGRA